MIKSRADYELHLREDLRMHGVLRWTPLMRVTNRALYFQRLLRRAEYWSNCRTSLLWRLPAAVHRLRANRVGEQLGMSIPRNVFGPGLSIAHVGTIVANGNARVGARCRIHQCVTIAGGGAGFPVIGDDVFIGPNVVIVGPITVGDRAHIRAGAVVTKDVPDGAIVQGTAASIVRADPEAKAWNHGLQSA